MKVDYLAISLVKKIVVSERVSALGTALIIISGLFFIPIIYNLVPTELDIDYRGTNFIKANTYWIIINTTLFIIGILIKANNYRKVFVLVKFYDNKLVISNKFKQVSYDLKDIELIEYKFSNLPDDLVIDKEKHWITIKPKQQKELYSEFIGDSVQMDLIDLLSKYKDKGHNIKVDTIFK